MAACDALKHRLGQIGRRVVLQLYLVGSFKQECVVTFGHIRFLIEIKL